MKITALYVYPIKGLRALKLLAAPLTPTGFRHDRTFILLDATTHKKIQLSSHPACALFSQTIYNLDKDDAQSGKLHIRYHHPEDPLVPDAPTDDLVIPLCPEVQQPSDGITVDLYGAATTGYHVSWDANDWFSCAFGFPVLLLHIGSSRRTPLGTASPAIQARLAAAQNSSLFSRLWSFSIFRDDTTSPRADQLTFVDAAPLLVTTEASLRDVQMRLPEDKVTQRRFRPNIVVAAEEEDGADPEVAKAWAEDFWRELTVYPATDPVGSDSESTSETEVQISMCSPVCLLLTANCARCTSLNVCYRTGRIASNSLGGTLKTLSAYRRVDSGNRYSPVFGRYAYVGGLAEGKEFQLMVGAKVEVTERAAERDVWDWPSERELRRSRAV